MTYIYGLIDPRTSECRYVGKADNPHTRWTRHLQPGRLRVTSIKNSWLNGVLADGLKPELIILEQIPLNGWQAAEQWWIAYLQGLGARLTNGTSGGDGVIMFGATNPMYGVKGTQHPSFGKPRSEDVKERIRAAQKGKPRNWSEEGRQRIIESNQRRAIGINNAFFGHKHTAENKEIMSAHKKGRSLTDEHKARVSIGLKIAWAEGRRISTKEGK